MVTIKTKLNLNIIFSFVRYALNIEELNVNENTGNKPKLASGVLLIGRLFSPPASLISSAVS